MKVKVKALAIANNYPCIKEFDNQYKIVLFTCKNRGICLKSKGDPSQEGKYESWDEDVFSPFIGTITLEN